MLREGGLASLRAAPKIASPSVAAELPPRGAWRRSCCSAAVAQRPSPSLPRDACLRPLTPPSSRAILTFGW